MEFSCVPNEYRGMKLVVNEKHLKTIPLKLLGSVNGATVEKLNADRKRLSPDERKLLTEFVVFEKWKTKLSTSEKNLYDLIKTNYPVSKRTVITLTGSRLELCLNSQLKIKVPEKVYNALSIKETTIHSNY